ATVKQGITIGNRAVIGCGAVVVDDIPAGETWVGVPARPLVGKL
ncbi:MAG: acetyltransferase, partial [Candidatus Atribacteria bacterium]|nr:acetyltransferase [Candidatus Atribacteria bacterium]